MGIPAPRSTRARGGSASATVSAIPGARQIPVAGVDALPFGMDPVRAVDVAAEEVLEPVVAVEPATPLTELGDPRPDVRGVRADGDGPRRHHVSLRKQGVAGQIP